MTMNPSAVAAFLSVFFISFAPNVLLFLFPNYSASSSSAGGGGRALLSLGQALAVGGLLGDVFLHTLPECFADSVEIHDDDHQHTENDRHHHHGGGDIGLRVLVGFGAFLIMDILVRSLEDCHEGGHSHSQPELQKNFVCNGNGNQNMKKNSGERHVSPWRIMLSSTVLLNLIGDALHNFTDGLAIGATFAASKIPHSHSTMASAFSLLKSRGGLASISVFLHEIPHELGDFATLVNAGLSRNMAIGAQFLTAIAAFMGTALGLFSSQLFEGLGHEVLLPFTSGGFVYLACVTILPEILETEASIKLRLMQLASFAIGIAFMYAVAELEEMEEKIREKIHHDATTTHSEL